MSGTTGGNRLVAADTAVKWRQDGKGSRVPTILIVGLYNKLVRVEGHD
jgi:hypothetical protein